MDLEHVWHPDSFGTQFSNSFLTIDVNRLSNDKVWCDVDKVPPWAILKSNMLLCEPQFFGPEPEAKAYLLRKLGLVVPSYKNLCKVCISPSKELEEVKTSSWLGRKINYDSLYGKSVAAEPTQPC
ncbi:hypothetical protein FF1_000567 [Malus domestica]